MWRGPRPTSIPGGIFIHPSVWPQYAWAKIGGLPPFGEGSWVPIQHNVAWPKAYLPAKCHLDPSSRMGTIDMCRKLVEGLCSFFSGGTSPRLPQCGLSRGLLYTKWHLDPSSRFATIDMGRKLGVCLLVGRLAGSPSRTMWSGPRPTKIPSAIMIYKAIWPQ